MATKENKGSSPLLSQPPALTIEMKSAESPQSPSFSDLRDLDFHEQLLDIGAVYDDEFAQYFADPGQPRYVMVSFTAKRLGDIDSVSQTFRLRFHMYYNWLPTREEYLEAERCEVDYWSSVKVRKWLLEQEFRSETVETFFDAGIDGASLLSAPKFRKAMQKSAEKDLILDITDEEIVRLLDLIEQEKLRLVEHSFSPEFVPRPEPRNAVEVHSEEHYSYHRKGPFKLQKFSRFAPSLTSRGQYDPKILARSPFIRVRINYDVTFSEEFELENFPFDAQDMTVIFREYSTTRNCIFVPEARTGSFFGMDPSTSDVQEWNFQSVHVEILHQKGDRSSTRYSEFIVRIKLIRNWRYYFNTIIIFLILISGISMCSFTLTHEELGDRLAFLLTLLLTATVFQDTISSSLPNTSYMTLMDKYILITFVYIFFVTVASSFVRYPTIEEKKEWKRFDTIIFWISLGLWIAYNVVFFLYGKFVCIPTKLTKTRMNPIELAAANFKEMQSNLQPVNISVQHRCDRVSKDEADKWYRFVESFNPDEQLKPIKGELKRNASILQKEYPKKTEYCMCEMCVTTYGPV